MFASEAIRYLTMTEARIDEGTRQAEFEAFYLRTSRTLHGYLCRLSRDLRPPMKSCKKPTFA